jgi:hypothetical protein
MQGCRFLIDLFDPKVDLLPEFPGSKTYWLFHDNYLAAHMLAEARPDLAHRIKLAIAKFGVTHSGKIEILFNESSQALPFRVYQLTDVSFIDGKRIRTESLTTNLLNDWEAYADLLLLASIAQAKDEPVQARRRFDQAWALWDGQGFKDRAARSMGIYSTYKLALHLIAAERLSVAPADVETVRKRLLSLQSKGGGWITDYKDGQPVGLANVETTCLAILALQLQPR